MKYDKKIIKNSESIKQYPNSERVVEVPFILSNMPEPPAKVLDVGCCDSDLVMVFNKLGFDAWGIDCRKGPNFGDPAFYFQGDARDLPYGDEAFDVVTCVSALEHFGFPENHYDSDKEFDPTAQKQAVDEMIRVLRIGGTMLLTLPYGKGAEGYGWEKWVKFYDWQSIVDLFEGTGMMPKKLSFSIRRNGKWREATEKEAAETISEQDVVSNIKLKLRRES